MSLKRRIIHIPVVVLMLFGVGAAGIQPAAAQVSGDAYNDPAYDWDISWDSDIWTVVDNPSYELVLKNDGDSYVFFQNRDEWGDAQDCLDGRVDEVTAEDGVDDVQPLEDDNGDPIGASSNDRATATYSLTYTNPNRDNASGIDRINAFDCRVLVPGEAVLAITYVTSADAYENDVDDVGDLLDALDIPETSGTDETPTGTPEDEPTATPTEAVTATPDEDEPTATPDETTVSNEAPDPGAGIDGNTYTSPSYGYSVEWDEDIWTLNVTANQYSDRDTLVLDYESDGYVYFEAYDDYNGDPADCLDGSASEFLDDPAADNVEPFKDENGDVVAGEEDGVAFAAYTFDFHQDSVAGYFECRTLVEDETVLAISLVTSEDVFPDARDDLADLLDSLDLGDVSTASAGDETPTAEPTSRSRRTPTPEDAETPTATSSDSAGVDGATYTSPTYGYSLEWDEDLWSVNEDQTDVGDRDVLVLDYADSGTLFVEGYEDYGGDAVDCLDGSSAELLDLDSTSRVKPLEDDNGDPIEGEEDGVAFAAYSLDLGDTGAVAYFTCQTLIEDEAVLAFSVILPEEVADDGIADFMDVQASLELANSGSRTPTPEDQETPTPDSGDDSAGVNGNAYESPTYGFTMEWDEDVWVVDEASSGDGVDRLVLSDAGSTVTFEAMEAFDGDAAECAAAAEDEIAGRRRVSNVEILEDEDGPITDGDAGYAYTYYGYTLAQRNGDTEEMYEYVECSSLDEGSSVLRTSQVAAVADATEELDALDKLLDGVDIASNVAGAGGTAVRFAA